MKLKTMALAVGVVLLLGAPILAGVPDEISFMGRLVKAGTPVTFPVNMTFELFTGAAGGSNVWSDAQVVTPNGQGVYLVELGSGANPIPASHDTLWIQVTVGTTVISPRRRFNSVPYALRSDTTDSVGSLPSLDVTGEGTFGGDVGIGTATPAPGWRSPAATSS